MRLVQVLPFFAPAALFFACQSQQPANAPMQLASTSVSELETAAERIATARCLSAERCFAIEDRTALGDLPSCRTMMTSQAAREIDFCHAGVDDAAIRACADAWTNGTCQGPDAPITAFPECTTERICSH